MPVLEFEAPDDPRLDPYRRLRESEARLREAGLVLVEGEQAFNCLSESGLEIVSVLTEPKFLPQVRTLLGSRVSEILSGELALLNEVVGYELHRGLFALVRRPASVGLETLSFPVCAFDGIVNAENAGSILRSAVAFGVRSVLVDSMSCDPLIRRAVRVSMGAALLCHHAQVESLPEALTRLRRRADVIAIETGSPSESLFELRPPERAVYVFGHETSGITKEVLSCCNRRVAIPVGSSPLSSLNVSAAASIVFAHVFSRTSSSRLARDEA